MLRDTTDRDLSVDVLGQRLPAPVLFAPIGAAGLITRDADIDVGAASAERGLPHILLSQGSSPMEATAAAMDTAYVTVTPSVTATTTCAASALGWFQPSRRLDPPL